MAANDLTELHSTSRRIQQPISVPFLWEEKPGTPKKDWERIAPPINHVAPLQLPPPPPPSHPPLPPPLSQPLPVKLIASVPFQWEESPGKPLSYFSQPSSDLTLIPQNTKLPLPPMYSQIWLGGGDLVYRDYANSWTPKSENYACGSETDESYSSAPSPSSNHLVSTTALSDTTPGHKTSLIPRNSGSLQSPISSPTSQTDSTSSYETGTASLVGTLFLERLFPLLAPDSGFLNKYGCSEKDSSHTPTKVLTKNHFDCEENGNTVTRRPTTLGELIMMSRRRSYQRKTLQKPKQNLKMELMKRSAFGCCLLGTGYIGEMHRKCKRQLQL